MLVGVHLIALEFSFCKNHNVIIVPDGVKYASSFFCADLILTTNPSYIHCLEPDSRDTVLFHPFGVAGGVVWLDFLSYRVLVEFCTLFETRSVEGEKACTFESL